MVAKALDLTGGNGPAARREFDILSSLQHEKIANLHSASANATSIFLILEKLSGIDVIEYLSMRPLYTEETVSRIIHQVSARADTHVRSVWPIAIVNLKILIVSVNTQHESVGMKRDSRFPNVPFRLLYMD